MKPIIDVSWRRPRPGALIKGLLLALLALLILPALAGPPTIELKVIALLGLLLAGAALLFWRPILRLLLSDRLFLLAALLFTALAAFGYACWVREELFYLHFSRPEDSPPLPLTFLQPLALGYAALLALALRPALTLILNFPFTPTQLRARLLLGHLASRLNRTGSTTAALTVLRIADVPGGPPAAIQIRGPFARPLTLRAGCGILLQSIQGQLRAQGARLEEGRAILAPSRKGQLAHWGADAAAAFLCLVLPWPLAWTGLFWGEWLLTGTYWMSGLIWAAPFCALASGLALASPLKGWIAGLLTAAWRHKTPSGGRLVQIIDELRFERLTRRVARAGWLSADAEGLTLGTAGQTWRIPREAIQELTPLPQTRFYAWLVSPTGRFGNYPVRLAWRAEEQGAPVLHSVLLTARAARGHLGALRQDRRLASALRAWRERPGAAPIPSLTPHLSAPARLGQVLRPAAMALFILASLAAPFLHNHLLMTRIRTGQWAPRPRLEPGWGSFAFGVGANASLDAVNRSPILACATPANDLWFDSTFRAGFNYFMLCDPLTNQRQLLFFTNGGFRPSFGGALTHYLAFSANSGLVTALFPPTLNYSEADGRFPHQVIEIATGRRTEIRSLPGDPNCYSKLALFGGERIFYALEERTDGSRKSIDAEYGWVDVRRDVRHRLGRIRIDDPRESQQGNPPAFFPDGRHVLYAWRVIDCDTGAVRPVFPGIASVLVHDDRLTLLGFNSMFTRGPRLCLQAELRHKALSTPTGYEPPQLEKIEIWEIDPRTAERRVIELPRHTKLLSAEGDRWLLRDKKWKNPGERCDPKIDYPSTLTLSLFNPVTRQVRPLLTQRDDWRQWFRLVCGRDEILEFSVEKGWTLIKIPREE